MNLRRAIVAACLLMGLRAVSPAAQEAARPDSLAPTTLDPLVTTATRDERSLTQVPAAMSVTDSVSLRAGRTIGLHETLRMMPGVQVASRTGAEEVTIGIRGSAARSRQAVRGAGVLLDGVLLTEPDGVARLDLIELSAVRQVEVVRGPASALYAGSSGGVVNVLQRTGRDSRGTVLRTQVGSFGTEKYDGYLGDTFADGRGSLFLNGSYTNSDGYRAHSDGRIIRAGLNGDFRPATRTRVALEANGSDLDTRLPGGLTQAEFDATPDAASPIATTFGFGRKDRRYRVGARVEQGLDADGTSLASGYLFYGGRTLYFPIVGSRVDLNLHRVQTGGRVRAARVGGAPIDLTAGVDYDIVFSPDRRWNNVPGRPDTLIDQGRFSAPNVGLYGQAEWHAARTVDVTAGLRWDDVTYHWESTFPGKVPAKDTTFSQASPKGTVTWRPAPGRSFYASVARGFEVPAFGELSPSPGDSFSAVGPKSLWNYEVGTHLLLGGRVLAGAALFYADIVGEFVPAFGPSGLFEPENASRSRNIGLEVDVTAIATKWLEVYGSYTFSDFRLQDFETDVQGEGGTITTVDYSGNVLPGIPAHRITGEARVRAAGTVEASVQLEWQSAMFVETGNRDAGTWYSAVAPNGVPFRSVPARAAVHLGARWQPGPLGVFGSVENLFGTRFAASILANDAAGRFYEPGPGTVLTIGLSLAAWPRGRAAPIASPN
jgi:iron complex outermembrane receptor protein